MRECRVTRAFPHAASATLERAHRRGQEDGDVGIDRVTKVLLGVIAAGVWALVLLQVATTRTVSDMAAEVRAIGADTQSIHEDMDAAADDDVEGGATRYRRD
jgi:hypothetical protein